MTNFGRHSVIVLLVAILAMPAGVALADQDRGEETASVLERIEQWMSGLWDWVAGAGVAAEPNGEPVAVQDAEVQLEPSDAQQRAGVHLEPGG